MARLLMIAYKFPPMHNTSCVRTWGFYRHVKPYFEDVHVISTSNRHLLRQEPVDLTGVNVYDARTSDYRTILQADQGKQSVLRDETKESTAGRVGQKLNASFPTLYLFGEGGLQYIYNGGRIGGGLVEREGITHVFSTFSPYADHIIAFGLKQQFPHLYWIADFRDLHVDPTQNNLLWRNFQRKQNARILSKADCLTTVSHGLAAHLEEYNDNVFILRNGIEEVPELPYGEQFQKFTLTYTGSMYGDKRNPEPLLRIVRELIRDGSVSPEEIEICYAGKDSDVWRRMIAKHELNDVFRDLELVSRKDALELQRRSHVNILLTYSSDELKGNVTGKVFEYMRAMRPIVVIINGPQDQELEEIMTDMPGGVYYMNDSSRLKSDLIDWLGDYREEGAMQHDMKRAVEPFLWSNAIVNFVEHIGLDTGEE